MAANLTLPMLPLAASLQMTRGVFVNPALQEPFGLTGKLLALPTSAARAGAVDSAY